MFTNNRNFLAALQLEPQNIPPAWIMRQAGRYLPEYLAVRKHFPNFLDMCKTPEVCCELVLQPIERFDLDAAIIFSDILTIPDALDLGVIFKEGQGPVFKNPIRSKSDIKNLKEFHSEKLNYVYDTTKLTKQALPSTKPLIGFTGSPWTLAAYSIEGKSPLKNEFLSAFLVNAEAETHDFLNILTSACFLYLKEQIISGADAVQIFDSWANLLKGEAYDQFSLNYIKKLLSMLKKDPITKNTPIILFARDPSCDLNNFLIPELDCLSLYTSADINEAMNAFNGKMAIQGNLNPKMLLESDAILVDAVKQLSDSFQDYPGYIFNLGHGITPDINPEKVAVMLDALRS